ncbi:MAG: tryptophan--tRNA ligase [SAR202 cluster bacterium]|nr:tryptophan--tRNA ligase [SAR202 cluster bacterium]
MANKVFSAMRPSGRLHLGNYFGALENWVRLQGQYECVFAVADVHTLTTVTGKETEIIKPNTREMVLDWLAAGLDPGKSLLFAQSQVPEVLVLHSLLSMVTPLGWLLRVPTFKERVRQMNETEENVSYGLVGYPVLQTADIILLKADRVPVGIDQVPHIELSREIVRRFNNLYGETFPEPRALLTETPSITGIDGVAKMSKSLDNHLELAATAEETSKRVMTMVTDPQRQRRSDPGRPEVCNVYSMHKLFNPGKIGYVHQECTTAGIGCVDCKKLLAEGINRYLSDFRTRRAEMAANPGFVDDVLADGARRARALARETIDEVYQRIGLGTLHG